MIHFPSPISRYLLFSVVLVFLLSPVCNYNTAGRLQFFRFVSPSLWAAKEIADLSL